MAVDKLHADDTPMPSLATGKTKTGPLWTYLSDDAPCAATTALAIWFSMRPDCRASSCMSLLVLDDR